jgi:hypothetical protein
LKLIWQRPHAQLDLVTLEEPLPHVALTEVREVLYNFDAALLVCQGNCPSNCGQLSIDRGILRTLVLTPGNVPANSVRGHVLRIKSLQ